MKSLELALISLLGFSLSLSQNPIKPINADLNRDGVEETIKVNKTETGFYELSVIDGKTNKSTQRFPRYSGYAGVYVGQDGKGKYLIYFTEQEKNNVGSRIKRGFKITFENSMYVTSYKEFKEEEYPELFK